MIQQQVRIVEVGPRDGLQNESSLLSVEQRVEFINLLTQAGHRTIEVGSFVSPKWIPQMAHTKEVYQQISKSSNCSYSVLVPNHHGLSEAINIGCTEIAIFAAASETFSKRNINCSIAESLRKYKEITAIALKNNIKVRAYISCIFECPYEGIVAVSSVVDLAKQLYQLGCYEVSLGDTTGVGTPLKAQQLIQRLSQHIPVSQLAVHFHDTYGQALTNIYAVLPLGITVIDASVGGLGGCPYAKGASGNVATEDVVYMLNGLGIDTYVDLDNLFKATQYICSINKMNPRSKWSQAKLASLAKENTND